MSNFTTELRYIYPTFDDFDKVMKSYPIFKEEYRSRLNERIYEAYEHREIGQETPALFKKFLDRKMRQIMPLYNQRYSSEPEILGIRPVDNVDMTETFSHTTSGTGKTTRTDNTTSSNTTTLANTDTSLNEDVNVMSDTPQSDLTDLDIKSNKYATQTVYNKNNSENSENSTSQENGQNDSNGEINNTDNRTESWTRHEYGSSKGYTFAQNINQWRDIMLNIDMEIVEELEGLFCGLW